MSGMRYARTLIDKLVTNAGNVPTMTTERREHSPCIAGSLPCRRARQRLVGIRFFFLCSITIPFLLLCLSLPKSIVLLHQILEGVEESWGGGGLSSCPLRDQVDGLVTPVRDSAHSSGDESMKMEKGFFSLRSSFC